MIKINSKFKPLYTSKKRYFILTGGRGGGKTYAVLDYLVRLTFEENHGILFTRYTMTSAEKSIIPSFKKTLSNLGVSDCFIITKTKITNKVTGSFIFFSGIKVNSKDQTANLKSLPDITTWVIEEGEDYTDEKSFIDIDDSIRVKGIQNRIIWIQNPSHVDESFIYKRFYKGHEVTKTIDYRGQTFQYTTTSHPKVENIHITYIDNYENIDEDKRNDWDELADTRPEFFEHKYIGGWLVDKEGALFNKSEFDFFKLDDLNTQNTEAVVSAIDVADEGTDSLSMPIARVIGDKIYIVDWVHSKENTEYTRPLCASKTKEHKISHLAIETNGIGSTFYKQIMNEVKSGTALFPINQTTKKHERIVEKAHFLRNHVIFRSDYEYGSEYDLAMREFFQYMKSKKENNNIHDDAPDAITLLASVIMDLFAYKYF